MKVMLVSHADGGGGAAIAAYRLHRALRLTGVKSRMLVLRKTTDDSDVDLFNGRGWRAIRAGVQRNLARKLMRLQRTPNKVLHSPAIFRTGLAEYINASDADVVNLHWICEEMISIEEIGEIRKPVVWTLHDTWPFCGAEHYFELDAIPRYRDGYHSENRPTNYGGLDIDKWVWERKAKAWNGMQLSFAAPSQWMCEHVGASALFRNQPAKVIHNGLDLNVFKPLNKMDARDFWNIQKNKKIIMFGAINSTQDIRKGFFLLQQALNKIVKLGMSEDIELVVFGDNGENDANRHVGLRVHYMGKIDDAERLVALYAAADIFVTPSMQDNFPNTLIEAMACGVPCVGFKVGGVAEIISHGVNGYLVEPFSVDELTKSIMLLLKDINGADGIAMRQAARSLAIAKYGDYFFAKHMKKVFIESIESRVGLSSVKY